MVAYISRFRSHYNDPYLLKKTCNIYAIMTNKRTARSSDNSPTFIRDGSRFGVPSLSGHSTKSRAVIVASCWDNLQSLIKQVEAHVDRASKEFCLIYFIPATTPRVFPSLFLLLEPHDILKPGHSKYTHSIILISDDMRKDAFFISATKGVY